MKKFDYSILNTIRMRKGHNSVVCHKYTRIVIHKTAKIKCNGSLRIGNKENEKSKQETRLSMGKNSKLNVNGNFSIGFGSDIRIFDNAELELKSRIYKWIYTNCLCKEDIYRRKCCDS